MICLAFVLTTIGCGAGHVEVNPLAAARVSSKSFSVMTYGATAKGTADDALAIQRTIDATAAAGGGQVTLPCGEFSLQSVAGAAPGGRSLLYSKGSTGVQIVGQGSCTHLFTVLAQKTVLEFEDSTQPSISNVRITARNALYIETFGMAGGSAVRFTGVRYGNISHVEVDGAAAGALYITAGTSHSSIDNNNVHDTYGSGIWEDNCGGGSATDCTPYRTPTGNTYDSNTLRNTSLAMPTAMTTDNGGMPSQTMIRNNTISWTKAPVAGNFGVHCLQVGNSADVTVLNNSCTGAPYDGIVITSSNKTPTQRITLQGNIISLSGTGINGGAGIVAYDDVSGGGISEVTMTYNNISKAAGDGIRLISASRPGTVNNIQILNNSIDLVDQLHPGTRFGVDVELADQITVSSNTITGNGRCIAAGVNFVATSGAPPTATANQVTNIMGKALVIR